MNLMQRRDASIEREIRNHIVAFLNGSHLRHCAACGVPFKARGRYHFFCAKGCRSDWYSGQFVRPEIRRAKARKAA